MSYQFPELGLDQVVDGMKNILNIRVEDADFKKPDPNRWQEIYQHVLSTLTDSPVDVILQQQLHSDFEYPELHEESVPLINFLVALQHVMQTCGINNFSIRDLTEPKTARLLKIGSAIINFCRFKMSRLDVYHKLKQENERHREQYEHFLKANDELRQKINKIKAEKAAQEPEILKVQARIEELKTQMSQSHGSQTSLQKSISETKAKVSEKKAACDQLRVAIAKGKEEGERLSQKIVQSPERVRDEQENMKHQLIALKASLEKKRERHAEVKQQRERIKQTIIDTEKGFKLLEAIQVDIDKEKEVSDEIAQIVEKCHEKHAELQDIENKKQQFQHLLNLKQEKLAKLAFQHQSRMKQATEQLEKLKEDREKFLHQLNADDAKASEVHAQKRKIMEELESKKKETELKIQNIQNLYSQILEKVGNYESQLAEGWDKIRQLLTNSKHEN